MKKHKYKPIQIRVSKEAHQYLTNRAQKERRFLIDIIDILCGVFK